MFQEVKASPASKVSLPKAGCRTLTDKQIESIVEYLKTLEFDDYVAKTFARGFLSGICFLGVDDWEAEYGMSFDEFLKHTFDIFEHTSEG